MAVRDDFAAGEVLAAADLNDTFASKLDKAGGKILQVVSTTKTDTFSASMAEGVYTAVTGLSASITPSAASSKILVMASVNVGDVDSQAAVAFRLMRGATAISIGDAASPRSRSTTNVSVGGSFSNEQQGVGSILFLDSPATTSATTYSIEVGHHRAATVSVFVNRSRSDGANAYFHRSTSTITVMEVSG